MHRFLLPLGLVTVLATGCGGSTPEPQPVDEGPKQTRRTGPSISADADIGALDEGQVTQTFEKAQSGIMSCMQKGRSRLPYLSGTVRFHVRVNSSGKASSAHLLRSTVGDRETESCMLDALRSKTWPAPIGGREGIAETEFTFDPEERVRQPVEWAAGDAGKSAGKAAAALAGCRSSAGAGPLTATVYVETDGTVLSVGVSGADAATEQAASCVVSALKSVKFDSPGSYAAKLTLGGS